MVWTGEGQTVVVIDTGWSTGFTGAARGNIVAQYDLHDGDGNADSGLRYGHGGAVAGAILEDAPAVDLIHLKVFADRSSETDDLAVARALDWVIEHGDEYGVDVVNLSLTEGHYAAPVVDSILADEVRILTERGVKLVAATGNAQGDHGGDGVGLLAALPGVIGVSATAATGGFMDSTQRHVDLTDLAAPGENLEVSTGTTELFWSGSSFAAPQVTAAIALLNQASEVLGGEGIAADAALDWMRRTGDRFGDAEGFVELDTDGLMTAFTVAHGGDAATDWLV